MPTLDIVFPSRDRWVSAKDLGDAGILRGLQVFIAGVLQYSKGVGLSAEAVVTENEGDFTSKLDRSLAKPLCAFVEAPRLRRTGANRYQASWRVTVTEWVEENRARSGHKTGLETAECVAAELEGSTPPWDGWAQLRFTELLSEEKYPALIWVVTGTAEVVLNVKEHKDE